MESWGEYERNINQGYTVNIPPKPIVYFGPKQVKQNKGLFKHEIFSN